MAWTTDDIEALEKAIATGALIVEFKDRKLQYRSLDEMRLILSDMRGAVEAQTRTGGRVKQFRISSSRGF